MADKRERFFEAMKAKMDRKTALGRSAQPWTDLDYGLLRARLTEEYHEWRREMPPCKCGRVPFCETDELLDIANFAMFLWLKLEGDDGR